MPKPKVDPSHPTRPSGRDLTRSDTRARTHIRIQIRFDLRYRTSRSSVVENFMRRIKDPRQVDIKIHQEFLTPCGDDFREIFVASYFSAGKCIATSLMNFIKFHPFCTVRREFHREARENWRRSTFAQTSVEIEIESSVESWRGPPRTNLGSPFTVFRKRRYAMRPPVASLRISELVT